MDEEKEYVDNIGLIYTVIKNNGFYWRTSDEYQDLLDAGTDGLLNAIRTYNEEEKTKKSTYYCVCIKNEICKMLYLKECKKRKGETVSLNTIINEDAELLDFIPDNTNIEKDILEKELASKLLELVNKLPIEKDREAIKELYGLEGRNETNGEQLAKKWGVNKNAIYRRQRRALIQLWLRIRQNDEREKLFED